MVQTYITQNLHTSQQDGYKRYILQLQSMQTPNRAVRVWLKHQ